MEEKILVTRSSMAPMEEYVNEIKDLWETHWLTNMGVKHNYLQRDLEAKLGVEHVELLTNGHMALELSLQALGLSASLIQHHSSYGKKAEVITTPYTFDPATYTIDVTKIESLITDNTVAIVPVHVYGNICNVMEIERIARKYELKVIYDAAHAFGETYKEKGIATFGDVSNFSFHATKV